MMKQRLLSLKGQLVRIQAVADENAAQPHRLL
jgi:hypothetical protein